MLDGSHTLNLAGPEVLTLRQIAEAVGGVVGRAPVFKTKPESAAGDRRRHDAAAAGVQWEPPTRFMDGLREWLG